jgi:hypothetical protein
LLWKKSGKSSVRTIRDEDDNTFSPEQSDVFFHSASKKELTEKTMAELSNITWKQFCHWRSGRTDLFE